MESQDAAAGRRCPRNVGEYDFSSDQSGVRAFDAYIPCVKGKVRAIRSRRGKYRRRVAHGSSISLTKERPSSRSSVSSISSVLIRRADRFPPSYGLRLSSGTHCMRRLRPHKVYRRHLQLCTPVPPPKPLCCRTGMQCRMRQHEPPAEQRGP